MQRINGFGFTELAQFVAAQRTKDAGFKNQIQFWIDRFGDRDIRTITVDDVEDGLDDLRRMTKRHKYINPQTGEIVERHTDKPLCNGSINRFLGTLGSVWRSLHQDGYLRRRYVSPTIGISRLSEATGKTIDVSQADINRLISAARLSRNRRLAAFVAFASTTGWRRGNLESVTWADLDLDRGLARAGTTKNGSPHWIPLVPFVVAELQKMRPALSQGGDLVFGKRDIKRSFTTALQRAGLPETWTIHSLRHAAASILTQSGAPIQTVAAALNHKTLHMAMRYSHQNTDSLRASLTKAWR